MNKIQFIQSIMIFGGALPLASCGPSDSANGDPSRANRQQSISKESATRMSAAQSVSSVVGQMKMDLALGSMPLNTFWQIMAVPASVHDSELEQQEAVLADELRTLSKDDLVAFKITYDQVMNEVNHWDLWAAAYYAGGGCSDDGFTYFRNWLIGRGERAFLNALRDPDSLADFDLEDEFDMTMACEWDVLPSIIWDEQHPSGPDLYDILPDSVSASFEPKGEPFDEDDMDGLKIKFPRLTERYGHLWS